MSDQLSPAERRKQRAAEASAKGQSKASRGKTSAGKSESPAQRRKARTSAVAAETRKQTPPKKDKPARSQASPADRRKRQTSKASTEAKKEATTVPTAKKRRRKTVNAGASKTDKPKTTRVRHETMMVDDQKVYLTNVEGKGRFLGKYCGKCGTPTAWAQSRKTGKYYLCETQAVELDKAEEIVVLYALPQYLHSEYCGTRTDVFEPLEEIDLGDYQLVDAKGKEVDPNQTEEAEKPKRTRKRTTKPKSETTTKTTPKKTTSRTTRQAKAKADATVDAAEKKTQAKTGTRKTSAKPTTRRRKTTPKKTSN